eukprot:TRINITY_DN34917_c0_g1_i1.p1 TRINITY_DN34917_c0_g1~~TRINITY_DN34917_c0_g1_i1.p1  ORF type:complete len:192 (+),score=19.97 TRINITY_DN34917_c0_g1_i1:259-834(+)
MAKVNFVLNFLKGVPRNDFDPVTFVGGDVFCGRRSDPAVRSVVWSFNTFSHHGDRSKNSRPPSRLAGLPSMIDAFICAHGECRDHGPPRTIPRTDSMLEAVPHQRVLVYTHDPFVQRLGEHCNGYRPNAHVAYRAARTLILEGRSAAERQRGADLLWQAYWRCDPYAAILVMAMRCGVECRRLQTPEKGYY